MASFDVASLILLSLLVIVTLPIVLRQLYDALTLDEDEYFAKYGLPTIDSVATAHNEYLKMARDGLMPIPRLTSEHLAQPKSSIFLTTEGTHAGPQHRRMPH
ncbi:uncharacterized protein BDZ99DRAFT_514154 [Mytilinidion resinicola]|uniref:Uncharacterized protein n=1 Tax=Mytilinidion resinicola TaxID=574789 RepID=A0A6A6Z9Y5_9PEZI|nr:uncharacterized protein BDZ99DRAFT_514154 [Mytilinidion resinicola]KAF2817931.1 hypothetical protein BDZ99DRAFT_514154 [Mytilinidion resinicola]